MKVCRVSEMRSLDQAAIEQYGIPEILLMENAGLAAYSVFQSKFEVPGGRFLVFCGLGNNGGDGLVVARKIHSNGGEVHVLLLGDPARFSGVAQRNFEIVSQLPIDIRQIDSADAIATDLAHCDGVVDAIFGTGLTREVGGHYRDVIEAINASGRPVLSVDIPSGVHGDTGQVMGVAVRADYTVTFGLPKVGSLLYPGYALGGELYVSHISFPPALYEDDRLQIEVNDPPALPPRDPAGHKGTFGQALFVAGAASYFGAPYFSALSFMKAGGGYARLAAPRSMTPFIATKGSEIVFIPQEETASGSIARQNLPALLELSEQLDVVVLGPGISLDEEPQQLARELAAQIDKPLLIDGDGITALCQDLQILTQRSAPTILTPHPGEMSRLTGLSIPEVKADSIEVLQRTCRELNAIIVLKGAHTQIGYPDGRIYVNMSGNAGMATAGSGDVLTGTIAAMFGLGLPIEEATRKGVFIHGLAGDLAARDKGEDGITAQDILEALPHAMKADREGIPAALRDRYIGARVV